MKAKRMQIINQSHYMIFVIILGTPTKLRNVRLNNQACLYIIVYFIFNYGFSHSAASISINVTHVYSHSQCSLPIYRIIHFFAYVFSYY